MTSKNGIRSSPLDSGEATHSRPVAGSRTTKPTRTMIAPAAKAASTVLSRAGIDSGFPTLGVFGYRGRGDSVAATSPAAAAALTHQCQRATGASQWR